MINRIGIILFCIVCISCSKDDSSILFSFKTDKGYIHEDASIKYMNSAKIGILLEANPPFDFRITNNDNSILDTSILVNYLNIDFKIVKSIESLERLKFMMLRDQSIVHMLQFDLTRETGLKSIDLFYVGAHMNDTLGSFYSISKKKAYDDSTAFKNQNFIDFIYYFDSGQAKIASPSADNIPDLFDPDYAPQDWGQSKQTLFCPVNFSINDFDELINDSLLITEFNEDFVFSIMDLQKNDVYLFKTNDQKYAAFKVVDITGEEEGYVQLSIKIQK